ncbi:MAG: hypothetical protein ACR2PT_05075 [Endozoicomonas sp.]
MAKPASSHMEAYLQHLGVNTPHADQSKLEAEYLRSIYRVLPRKRALAISVKQARSETCVKP